MEMQPILITAVCVRLRVSVCMFEDGVKTD